MIETVQSQQIITLKIDGIDVSGRADETILEVARENNVDIPTMCYVEGLSAIGACRLCLVEVTGINKLLPACTTKISEGMDVTTQSEKLLNYRQMIQGMMFSERNHVCSSCVSNGHCELQGMLQTLDMDHIRVPYLYPKAEVDASHEQYVMDHNRCILCSACVRACSEIEGAHTKDVMGRGINARIITDFAQAWGEAESCTKCGKCVQVCPTGALFEKGKAASEQVKRRSFVSYLNYMREDVE